MAWTFKNGRPIYLQIADIIKRDIFVGKYAAGDKIPGVRELALVAAVNPNTIQHAMNLLEEEGILVTPSTAGRFVTDDAETLARLRDAFAESECREFVSGLDSIGLDREQILSIVKRVISSSGDGTEQNNNTEENT